MKKLYYENIKKYLKNNIFLFTIVLCIVLNFFFLRVVLKNGLTGDDWQLLFAYKTFDPQPLNRILDAWMIRGPYTTIQFYYIGILEAILGINYQLFQIINISFKVFASITLFILIYKLFKSYFLASSSAVIFSIIHSSAGAFKHVVKGTEYLAIGFMNLFFIVYYYCVAKNSIWMAIFSSLILFLAFILSPIRIYPLLGLIPLIELYLVVKNKNIGFILKSFTRLILFYFPIIFLTLPILGSSFIYKHDSVNFIDDFKEGNWYFFQLPLKALGYTLLGNDQFHILDRWLFKSSINIPSFLGICLLVISLGYLVTWIKKGGKLDELLLLFFGPFFAFYFIVSTGIVQGKAFNIIESLHWYLIIPSMGISVFLSGVIYSLYNLWIKSKKYLYLYIAILVLVTISFVSYHEINRHFNNFLNIGAGREEQSYMQNTVLKSLGNEDRLNLFVYFDGFDDPNLHQFYAVSLNLGYFEYQMLYFKKPNFLGCISYVTDKGKLIEAYEGKYFESEGLCAVSRYDIKTARTIYDTSDFRAFLLRDKKIFNITEQILEELRLTNLYK